jgi:diaminopimelate decarboxylase
MTSPALRRAEDPPGGRGRALPRTLGGAEEADLRAGCEGLVALSGRLEPWQVELCRRPDLIDAMLEEHGSPVNLIDPSPMRRNADDLARAASGFEVDCGIFFARKANKALALVDEARRLGLGVDLASERELAQVLERGVPGSALVMTAAVKPVTLLERCVASATTIVVDNLDELRRTDQIARSMGRVAVVALRLAAELGEDRLQTRFGFGLDEAVAVGDRVSAPGGGSAVAIAGVHFHLDGYDRHDRVIAIGEAFALVDALRERGHEPAFVDIGGGIPVSHLESGMQWERFWSEHRRGLLGEREPLTFEGHGLGLLAHRGDIVGSPAVYPFHQSPTGGAWLADVLAGDLASGGRVADGFRARGLQLRCEPGRALLDGCGMTAARVAYRKQRRDGTWLIGVEMNRTQCRSTSDDFLVDPLLLRARRSDGTGAFGGEPSGEGRGHTDQDLGLSYQDDGLLDQDDGLPDQNDGLPDQDDGLPDQDDGLPDQSHGLADRSRALQVQGHRRRDRGRDLAVDGEDTGPIEGYLVGAYCIERELLTWRRMRFPLGVRVGDVVVFPNTGGYLMHILESASHQIPLARNLIVRPGASAVLDPIDAG